MVRMVSVYFSRSRFSKLARIALQMVLTLSCLGLLLEESAR